MMREKLLLLGIHIIVILLSLANPLGLLQHLPPPPHLLPLKRGRPPLRLPLRLHLVLCFLRLRGLALRVLSVPPAVAGDDDVEVGAEAELEVGLAVALDAVRAR